MPENPFGGGGGIGSRGEQAALKAKARAVRSYGNELRRMMGMQAKAGSAAEASAQAAARAISMQNKAIGRTSSLLDDQGKALKGLDRVRQRYHDAEMQRTKSLAYHYEKAKQFLTELREDTDDTSTVLGVFTRGWKSGIDNMLRYGKLPEASQQIRELRFDWDDLGGSLDSILGHFQDMGRGMWDQLGAVNKLRQNMAKLDDNLVALDAKYSLAEGSGRKLGAQIVQMAAIDIGGSDGAIAQVTKLADQLTVLNTIAGVTAEQGLQFAIERSQQVGGTMEDAMGDIERFSAMADLMREHLEEDNIVMTRFSFAIREDFVKAMMEARRMLKGQVVDLENVGAAYQWAARKAIEYGASAEGASQFAKAFGKLAFGGDELTAESMMAGRRLLAQQETAMQRMEKQFKVRFSEMSAEQKAATEESVAAEMGIRGEGEGGALTRAQRGTVQRGIRLRGAGGLAPSAMASMMAATTAGMEARLTAIQKDLGMGGLDEATLAHLLQTRYGVDADQETRLRLAQQLIEGDMAGAVKEMTQIREEAEAQAAAADPRAALTAILAMRDPVQELFNIKNLLKVLVLNVDSVLEVLGRLDPTGTINRMLDYTRGLLGTEGEERTPELLERNQELLTEQTDIHLRMAEAREQFEGADTEEDLERLGTVLDSLRDELRVNSEAHTEVGTELVGITREQRLLGDELTGPAGPRGDAFTSGIAFISALTGGDPPVGGSGGTPQAGAGAARIGAGAARIGARASLGPSPEGAMNAAGEGEVTVGADGRAVMVVRMVIDNMQEVVAHATTELAQGIRNFL